MFRISQSKPAHITDDTPLLMVLVDTEEEFDWSRPLARGNTSVTAMRAQARAHRIFEKFGITPIYVADYPVVSKDDGALPLKELFDDGKCLIGAHLHPWVNPPFDEEVCNYNSYPGNLPAALERQKLEILTQAITERFGEKPVVYKAGRYGAGLNTTDTLEALGYQIDTSVLSYTDLRADDGPDFSACGAAPYWFGSDHRLLEIPMSVGFAGLMRRAAAGLYNQLNGERGLKLHIPGIFSRLGLLERITLTPEAINHQEHRRLTQAMLADGHKVFSFTYHSPSLAPGNTPYVTSETDLADFLDRFERYFDYFMGDLGGRPATPLEIRNAVLPTSIG